MPTAPPFRKGLFRDLDAAFELALDMTGSFPPDLAPARQAELRALRREVGRILLAAKQQLAWPVAPPKPKKAAPARRARASR